jgi:dihydrodipicolinate synthase/N-acetylneuraminate lyase
MHGVFSIAPTPFADSGKLDDAEIDRLTDFFIEKGVNGLAIPGVIGEASKLAGSERGAVVQRFIQRTDGRIPVVVGTGHQASDPAAQLSQQAEAAGAAAVLVAPPRLARPDVDAIRRYYNCFTGGDPEGAARVFCTYLPLIRFEFQPEIGLNIRKEVLRRRGALATARVREPAGRLDSGTLAELSQLMQRLNLA